MQAGTEARPSPVAMVIGIIGGALLAIGSFLTWATVSLDIDSFVSKIATSLNLDPAQVKAQLPPINFSQTISGMKGGSDGTLTLVAGILVLAFAVVVFVKANLSKVMGALMLVAGIAGAGVALWDLSKLNDAKDAALGDFAGTPGFQALQTIGFDAKSFSDVIKVSAGIGIYVCALGGIVAIVAGIVALMQKAPAVAVPAMEATSPTPSGFLGQSSTPSMPPVPTSEPTEAAAPASEPPSAEPAPEPPAPPAGGAST